MFSSRDTLPFSRQPCYFSLAPSQTPASLSSDTPLASPEPHHCDAPMADPSNPLLAVNLAAAQPPHRYNTSRMVDASNLFQLQIQASHQPERRLRPGPRPLQDDSTLRDDLAISRNSPSMTPSHVAGSPNPSYSDCSTPSPESSMNHARCSRCHRTPAVDLATLKSNMIEYGLNLFYCTRCAEIVGLRRRS
ncbi:hypothetical protein ANO11243_013640 [Dothideomycetidae sp. 11243]|nr:hypothetical protein ANO11243_013640 [fungal sp. No.11243]